MSTVITIEDYKPKPTVYLNIFKECGISQQVLANYLGRSYQHTTRILRGETSMPKAIEKNLIEFLDHLENGKVMKNGEVIDSKKITFLNTNAIPLCGRILNNKRMHNITR